MLYAGTALRDISPEKGVSLGGYPHHPRYNTGAHDPLYASCLFLSDGSERIVMAAMDILSFSKRYVREVRRAVFEKTGIPERNITLCCSHTHSAPRASANMTMDALERDQEPDKGFTAALTSKLIELILEAVSKPFEAELGIERGFCGREQGVGGNRRDPMGIADPEVWVIGVRDITGKTRAVFAKYALHPTFLHSDNLLVSADYPGYIRSSLRDSHPEAVFLFAQGTSGNQSPRYFRTGKTFAEAERAGKAIGTEIERILEKMSFSREVPLSVSSREICLDLRSFPDRKIAEAEVEKRRRAWHELRDSGAPEPEVWNAELLFLGAEDSLSLQILYEEGRLILLQDELPAEVQVIGIGDTKIVTLPGEIFVEYGLTIQYRSPFPKVFVIALANGLLPGYAATAQAYAQGGYESGASMLTAKSGEQLVEAAVSLLYGEG